MEQKYQPSMALVMPGFNEEKYVEDALNGIVEGYFQLKGENNSKRPNLQIHSWDDSSYALNANCSSALTRKILKYLAEKGEILALEMQSGYSTERNIELMPEKRVLELPEDISPYAKQVWHCILEEEIPVIHHVGKENRGVVGVMSGMFEEFSTGRYGSYSHVGKMDWNGVNHSNFITQVLPRTYEKGDLFVTNRTFEVTAEMDSLEAYLKTQIQDAVEKEMGIEKSGQIDPFCGGNYLIKNSALACTIPDKRYKDYISKNWWGLEYFIYLLSLKNGKDVKIVPLEGCNWSKGRRPNRKVMEQKNSRMAALSNFTDKSEAELSQVYKMTPEAIVEATGISLEELS